MNPLVYIIILHWNNYQDTHDCLQSLQLITYTHYEIVVVDNASTDDSVARLRLDHPQVQFVFNASNFGFAKGNNQGIELALKQGADYVLLINNDTIVSSDFLDKLVSVAIDKPRAGALSGTIYHYTTYDQKTNRIFYAGGEVERFTLRAKRYYLDQEYFPVDTIPQQVRFISGCLMMITHAALKEIGLLDEAFFFGVEDADYSLRIIQSEYEMYYVPDSIIWHKVSQSRRFSSEEFYNAYISRMYLAKKHMSSLKWRLWMIIYLIQLHLYSYITIKRVIQKHQLEESRYKEIKYINLNAFHAAWRGDFSSPMSIDNSKD